MAISESEMNRFRQLISRGQSPFNMPGKTMDPSKADLGSLSQSQANEIVGLLSRSQHQAKNDYTSPFNKPGKTMDISQADLGSLTPEQGRELYGMMGGSPQGSPIMQGQPPTQSMNGNLGGLQPYSNTTAPWIGPASDLSSSFNDAVYSQPLPETQRGSFNFVQGGGNSFYDVRPNYGNGYIRDGLRTDDYSANATARMDAINNQYRPIGIEGRTTQGPGAISQQMTPYQSASRVAEGKQIASDRGWSRNDSNIIYGPGPNVTGSTYKFSDREGEQGIHKQTRTNRGERTGMTPKDLGQRLNDYESGKVQIKNPEFLYADYFAMNPENQSIADNQIASGTVGSEAAIKKSNMAKGLATQIRNQQALQKATQYAPGLSAPSFSTNPASSFATPSYTNQTALGPSGMGPVTITNTKPQDLGWSTGSSYDPNTGLSGWSTTGLNGEVYYDQIYAQQMSAEAQRKANQAASAAATSQRRIAAGQRQDVINEVVNGMVANGRDKSMARIDAKNMSDAQLSNYLSEAATAAANAPNPQLQSLLDQFSNPNYGQAVPFNGPLMNGQQQGASGTASASSTSTPASVDQQYQQAVQQQQNYQQQQQQQQDLSNQYQQQIDAANAANNARYEDIIAGYQDNQQNISDYLTNQGNQQTEDVNRTYDRMQGSSRQDLINRGLGNTTVLSSTDRGVEEDRQRALRNSQEQIDRQRLTYQTAAQNDLLGAMERRTDAGPDLNQLIGLSQGLGNSLGSNGSYGGVNGGTAPAGVGNASPQGQQSTGHPYQPGYNPIFNQPQAGQQPQQQTQQPAYSGSMNGNQRGAGMSLAPGQTLQDLGGSQQFQSMPEPSNQGYSTGGNYPVYQPQSTPTGPPATGRTYDHNGNRTDTAGIQAASAAAQPSYSGSLNRRSDGSSTANAANGYVRPTYSPTLNESQQRVMNRNQTIRHPMMQQNY